MTDPIPESVQPKSLRDYSRLLRRRALLLAIVTVAAAALAAVLALGQKKSYTASATVNFVDPTRYAEIISGQSSTQVPATLAAADSLV